MTTIRGFVNVEASTLRLGKQKVEGANTIDLVVLIQGQGSNCCMKQRKPSFLVHKTHFQAFLTGHVLVAQRTRVKAKLFRGLWRTKACFVFSLNAVRAIKSECICEHHLTNSLESMLPSAQIR